MPDLRYRIFDVVIDSDVPLPELPSSSAARSDIDVRLRRRGTRDESGWQSTRRDDGMSISRGAGGWRIRFPRLADFIVSPDGTRVEASMRSRMPAATVRHLLIDQVLPLALSARGRLILHGSAVATGGRGVLFLGPSGSGKSTLALALARRVARLLSDDFVAVRLSRGRAFARASYAGARIWPDVAAGVGVRADLLPIAHYTEKRRVPRHALEGRAIPSARLHRIYVLDSAASAVRISRVDGRDALLCVLRHALRLDVARASAEAKRLDDVARLCGTVPVRRLVYPRDLARLDEVHQAIQTDLAASAMEEVHGS